MAKNSVFRVYEDEETMLKVYARRLSMADVDYQKREPEYKLWVSRYRNEVNEEQIDEDGHRVNVAKGRISLSQEQVRLGAKHVC